MRLNNHGWGTKEFIFSIVAILILLLVAAFNVHRLYSSLDESFYITEDSSNDNKIDSKSDGTNKESSENKQNNNTQQREYNSEHYTDFENAMVEASRSYVINFSPAIPGEGLRIDLRTLVDNHYISNLYDMLDGSLCEGYSIIFVNSDNSLDIRTYLKCNNYVTEGY